MRLSPPFSHPREVARGQAPPPAQLTNGHPASELYLHFLELSPNGKAAPASPPEGAVLPVDCTTLGIQGWGEGTSTEASVTGGTEVSPSRQSRSSAEEGVLAVEEAQQPAVWDRLLDDLLDLYREEGG